MFGSSEINHYLCKGNDKNGVMIKNIIFDLAGVVLNLDLERDTEALRSVGLPDFDECLRRPEIFQPMLNYLNGLSDAEDFLDEMHKVCSPDATGQQILDAMDAVLADVPKQRLERIVELRKRYRVFLLSNIYETAWQYAVNEIERHGYRVDDCFDKVFLSYEMRLAKPDPQIFHSVVEATGIVPEETLYFDDSRGNVDAGNRLGFVSHLVEMNHLEKKLAELDI